MFQITVLVSLKVYILCFVLGVVSACAAIQLISILGIRLVIRVLLFSSPPISCTLGVHRMATYAAPSMRN